MTRAVLVLGFSEKLLEAEQGCESALRNQDLDTLGVNIAAYQRLLDDDLARLFLLGDHPVIDDEQRQVRCFKASEFEIHPDVLSAFDRAVKAKISYLKDCRIAYFGLYGEQNVHLIEALSQVYLQDYQQLYNDSGIANIILTNQALWNRFYLGMLKQGGKLSLAFASGVACYFVPPLMLTSSSTLMAAFSAYAGVGAVSSGLRAVGDNAIEGNDLSKGVLFSVGVGGVLSAGFYGVGNYFSTTATVTKTADFMSPVAKGVQFGSASVKQGVDAAISVGSQTLGADGVASAAVSRLAESSDPGIRESLNRLQQARKSYEVFVQKVSRQQQKHSGLNGVHTTFQRAVDQVSVTTPTLSRCGGAM